MKIGKVILIGMAAFFSAAIILTSGCEYDVAEPQWEQDFEAPPEPEITQVMPDAAVPGVNVIEIMGANFGSTIAENQVFFNNVPAEILEASSTNIKVRRPAVATDSATVKVVAFNAIVVAKYGPYKVDPIFRAYGNFPQNNQLSAIVFDNNGTMYVIERGGSRNVYEISPDGTTTAIATTTRPTVGARMAPDGRLILMANFRRVSAMDLSTGEESDWVDTGERVTTGDFDSNHNFYTAGNRTDLVIVSADLSSVNLLGVYERDNITDLRVYDNYVYLTVELADPDAQNPEVAVWRHEILDANGSLGARELVFDRANAGDYSEATFNTLTFASDGTLYIGTNSEDPILAVYTDGSHDAYYKGILPTSAERLVWGNGDKMYMVLGGETWNVQEIEMGISGAPYYGRN